MKIKNIIKYDWFKRLFDRGRNNAKSKSSIDVNRVSEFDAIEAEIERRFGQLSLIQSNASNELVSGYLLPEDGIFRIREGRPLVYGYSMTIVPDNKPSVREFVNVPSPDAGTEKIGFAENGFGETLPEITEREPLVDVNTTDKEVKVVMEILGLKKEDIKIEVYDETVEVTADNPQRKYHKTMELPPETDIETARSRYNNGILEITFDKKKI
jgi:HSP20 family protein